MDDERSWRKTSAVYAALIVVFFAVPVGFACGTALIIRIVSGHEGIHDPIAAGGTVGAFVIGMWITGDFIIPWLLNILPTSLVKTIRRRQRRR